MTTYTSSLLFIGLVCVLIGFTFGGLLYRPESGRLPFMVYFITRVRAICAGTLVSNKFVLTAAACFMRSSRPMPDTNPIRIIYGESYRHYKRGFHVAGVKIYFPKIPTSLSERVLYVEKAPALLEMMTATIQGLDYAPKFLKVNYDDEVRSRDKCITSGWNFYYEYKIRDKKFILQRDLAAIFLTVANNKMCSNNFRNLTNHLSSYGNRDPLDKSPFLCMIDNFPGSIVQPCIGMYGAPLILRDTIVGIYAVPNGQYKNCSVASLYSRLSLYKEFLQCFETVFTPSPNLTVDIIDARDNRDISFDTTYYFDDSE